LPSDAHRAATLLRGAIRDLSAVVGEGDQLAQLHEALAACLDDRAEQEEHYALATDLYYRAGRFPDALRCLAAAHGRPGQVKSGGGSIRTVTVDPGHLAAGAGAMTSTPDRLEVRVESADDRAATLIVKTGRGASDVTVRLKGDPPPGGLRTRDGDPVTQGAELRIVSEDQPVEALLRKVLCFG
jgi:hypothetical protein